jgi:hypothetical protein
MDWLAAAFWFREQTRWWLDEDGVPVHVDDVAAHYDRARD